MKNKELPKIIFDESKRREPIPEIGLSHEEAAERIAAGACNSLPAKTTRSITEIIRDNSLTLFNILNLSLAALVIATGNYKNALFSIIAVCNTLMSIFQETRAKLAVDKLAILARGKARVVRDSTEMEIEQENIVLDDILCISAGNQIYADGIVLHCNELEVDESLLTGESDYVDKGLGDEVLSGSFVVAGNAKVRVMKIGADNYAAKLAQEAKREKRPKSELMRTLGGIIKILTFAIIPIGAALFSLKYFGGSPGDEKLSAAILSATAAMVGMIPEGLMLLTGVAFAVGAINLARNNTLVQSMPCVETLARVDVLCLDKTGTITDGSMTVIDVFLNADISEQSTPSSKTESNSKLSIGMSYAEQCISALIHAENNGNETNKALKQRFPSPPDWKLITAVPFSSARKWSGASFENKGSFVLGAPEYLFRGKNKASDLESYALEGYRVLALARCAGQLSKEALPDELECICHIIISDNIRPEAPETLQYFYEQQVELKVISGDNPLTVSSIALRAGLRGAEKLIDMSTVKDDAPYEKIAAENTIFGRVSPYQKQRLVQALKQNGHTVAMTGDGVNDVLALREADCSIAMASGSDAARSVSDFVLLTSNFHSMINVVNEGRRVVNNIERVASLYLVKTIYSAILSVIYMFVPASYPLIPIQQTPIGSLTVGIPSFFLALTPNYLPIMGKFVVKILFNALPAALTVVINILLIQFAGSVLSLGFEQTSTLCTLLTGTTGFLLLTKVSRPLTRQRIFMIASLAILFVGAFVITGDFFSLSGLLDTSLAVVYVPLILLCAPIMYLLTKCVRYLRRFIPGLADDMEGIDNM